MVADDCRRPDIRIRTIFIADADVKNRCGYPRMRMRMSVPSLLSYNTATNHNAMNEHLAAVVGCRVTLLYAAVTSTKITCAQYLSSFYFFDSAESR